MIARLLVMIPIANHVPLAHDAMARSVSPSFAFRWLQGTGAYLTSQPTCFAAPMLLKAAEVSLSAIKQRLAAEEATG